MYYETSCGSEERYHNYLSNFACWQNLGTVFALGLTRTPRATRHNHMNNQHNATANDTVLLCVTSSHTFVSISLHLLSIFRQSRSEVNLFPNRRRIFLWLGLIESFFCIRFAPLGYDRFAYIIWIQLNNWRYAIEYTRWARFITEFVALAVTPHKIITSQTLKCAAIKIDGC